VPDLGHAPTEHRLEVRAASGGGPITIVAQVEPGVAVQLADANFGLADWRMRAPERVQLWYGHPNLAGHALVALAGAVVATAPLGVAWASAVVALPAIVVTGSRAALLAFAVLVAALVVRSSRSWPIRRRWGLALVLGALAVLAVAVVEPNAATLQALNRTTDNAIPRTEIWGFAIETARARPWTGIAPATFAEAWRDAHPGDARRAPAHAHDLWLDLAVRYGVAGLFVAVGWTGSLVVVAARWAPKALVAVVPILVLQVFDTTLPIGWVLLPAVVAIGIAVRTRERPGGPTSGTS
jgi:O-antigen ligase